MSLTVRSLLAKVKPFRKDLEEDRALYAIQEAVRKICRQTMFAEETVIVPTVDGQPYVTVTPTGGDCLKVHLVRSYSNLGGSTNPTYAYKTLIELNQEQINNFESFRDYAKMTPTGWAYGGMGKLWLYPNPSPVEASFTSTCATNVMTATSVTGTIKIGSLVVRTGIANPTYIVSQSSGTDGGAGDYVLSTTPGTLGSEATTTGDFILEVTAAYTPQGEFDAIPLPDDAEDCIVAGALSTVLMLPGAGQNLALSKDREILHNRELGSLRAMAEFGQSGRVRAAGPVLATRSIRLLANRWY